jgi:hypothetical protein
VGILDAEGSSYESEVWVDARLLAADAKRSLPYSGFRVRGADGADLEALARRIDADPRWALEASPETEYYADQAESARTPSDRDLRRRWRVWGELSRQRDVRLGLA